MTTIRTNEQFLPIAFEIEVKLASPICLSSGVPSGNLTRTLDYIPGSTLRGILAQCYLEQTGVADERFEQLFISGDVTYGNLYYNHQREGAIPAPLSAYSCKHEAGFLRDPKKHGVQDLLLPTFVQSRLESAATADLNPHDVAWTSLYTHDRCMKCQAPLDTFARFYEPPTGAKSSVPIDRFRRVITRSSTDDRLQTAETGLLYSIEVLDPTADRGGLPASGFVICHTRAAADLVYQHVLKSRWEDAETAFFIGTARSRGMGQIVTLAQPLRTHDLVNEPCPLTERIQQFNHAIRQAGGPDNQIYFSLTLHADAIVQDEFARFYSTITPELLAWEMSLDASCLSLETYFTAAHRIRGWNMAQRTPKTEVAAIRMGAAFLYAATNIDDETLVSKLHQVETYGLGARRTEGFGRLQICDPFHVEAWENPL